MPNVAGKKGVVVSKRPNSYEMTEQQKLFREVLDRCKIEKGMKKQDLMKAMKECIPREWEKIKEERDKQPTEHNHEPLIERLHR